MSIIIRSTGMADKDNVLEGFPPNIGTVVDHAVYNVNSIRFKWKDPEGLVLNGTTYEDFSNWAGTMVRRKVGSYPTSPTDGTLVVNCVEKNKYSEDWYTDSGLSEGESYYYRFFPYNKNKVYNTTASMTFYETTLFSVDSTLKNNSWSDISKVAKSGKASLHWNIKDEIDVKLSGTFNKTLTFQIWGFNWPKYTRTESSGNPGIVFGCKNLMDNQKMNSRNTNSGGWDSTYMKSTVMENIYNSFPLELRNVITPVTIGADTGGTSASASWSTNNKVFIPSRVEMFGTGGNNNQYAKDTNSQQFTGMFPAGTSADTSRVKKLSNGSGYTNAYWLRSTQTNFSGTFWIVNTDGSGANGYSANDNTFGVCPMFCVG